MDTIKEGDTPEKSSDWRDHQDPRVRKHIAYCQNYVAKFDHGAPGHMDRHVVDTLAKQLDTWQEESRSQIQRNNALHAEIADLRSQVEAVKQHRKLDQYYDVQINAAEIERLEAAKNGAYAERNKCLVLVALMAQRLGLTTGIGIDPNAETSEWQSILFIDLPAGQVSWHLHESETHMFYFVGAYGGTWDGHATDEKYRRVVEPGL